MYQLIYEINPSKIKKIMKKGKKGGERYKGRNIKMVNEDLKGREIIMRYFQIQSVDRIGPTSMARVHS